MASFTTGLSALTASQRALEVVAQNIANANTPGYHRQVALLGARIPVERFGLSIGTGVEVTEVRRLRNDLIESAVTVHGTELSNTNAQLTAMRHIEALISAGEGSVLDGLEAFFNQLEQLAARPDDATLRRITVQTGVALGHQFNSMARDMDQARDQLATQIQNVVRQINPIGRRIAELNAAIQRAELRGVGANDLRDRRDQLVNELAQFVGIQVIEQNDGQATILLGGVPFVIGHQSAEFASTIDEQQQAVVTLSGSAEPITISSGTLGGLLGVHNQSLPHFRDRLDDIAAALIERLNKIHATGLGSSGPHRTLHGQNAVDNIATPLADAGLAFPPLAGSLFFSVTHLATGTTTLSEITIDPAAQSLSDIAAAVTALGTVQAIADPQTRTLKLIAAQGYAFDFGGRLDAAPNTGSITGSTIPAIAGKYRGTNNDQFTFQVVGNGTIGVTPGLSLQVRNAAGTLLTSLNIGQGYEPGSALDASDGVTVTLSSGTANNGDSFQTEVLTEPDTSGILAALGLNSLFSGRDAADIAVRSEIVANPALLASSQSGQPGDGSNLRRMAAVRDLPLLGNATQTVSQAILSMVGDVGVRVQELDNLQTSQQVLNERLEAERQSASGVDPNEELVRLVEYQRAFQLASRFISVVNESLNDLFSII